MSAYKNKSEILKLHESKSKNENNPEQYLFTKYRDSGELLLQGNAKNKLLHGKCLTFYKNGNIHCDLVYRDGEMNGVCKGYYLNASLAIEVLFDMGKAVYGVYYKKSGLKTSMTSSQLERKTEYNDKDD